MINMEKEIVYIEPSTVERTHSYASGLAQRKCAIGLYRVDNPAIRINNG